MKQLAVLIIGAAILFNCDAVATKADKQAVKGTITISATPDLYDLAGKWADGYSGVNPKMSIRVVSVPELSADNPVSKESDLTIVSSGHNRSGGSGEYWNMVIGRDAVVPVISSNNPFLEVINQQGISAVEFARIFTESGPRTWGTLLGNGKEIPVNLYLEDSEPVKASVAGFLNINMNNINGVSLIGGEEMIRAIRNDPYAIGFCRVGDIEDSGNMTLAENISLLPIDKNGNGRLDYMEQIYENVPALMRGIWIGKYPKALSYNVYLVASAKPSGTDETAFVKYLLSDGQVLMAGSGFSSLINSERMSKIAQFPDMVSAVKASNPGFAVQLAITLGAALVLLILLTFFILRYRKNNLPGRHISQANPLNVINENSVHAPGGLFFDKSHTWAFMETNGHVRIGIDDFLQHVTGPLTRVRLKKPGDKVRKGEPVLTLIQNGKQLTINSPVSGIIRAENTILFTDTSLVNSSPYEKGWAYKIEPTNWLRETQFLFMADRYREWIRSEFARVKDFLAASLKTYTPEYSTVILQDGGELKDHVLSELGPEIWEDFQTKFIDVSK